MKNVLRWAHLLIRPRNYASMLASVLLLIVASPLADTTPWGRTILALLVVAVLVFGMEAVGAARSELMLVSCLAALTVGFFVSGTWFNEGLTETNIFHIVGYCVCLVFFVRVGFVMLRDIFSGEVTGNRICGAVCVYLLLGYFFAILQLVALSLDAHALRFDGALAGLLNPHDALSKQRFVSMMFYFSFCTLTTLGYGDISPVSTFSRTVAWLEAVTGQLYLAVLIARLVGQHIAASAARSLRN